jgi:Transposase DDE domain
MKHISELRMILSHFFDWHKCRLDCLGQIIQALFVVRTINLTQVASAFKSEVKEESSYRRVCRFFTGFTFDMSRIVLLVFRLFPLGDKCTLILDRTNWKWGKTPINILMLSIAYRGIGIPLFWVVLNLEGNSCTEDRIDLLKRVVERLGISRIEVLLADREFVGTRWFRFLIEQKIPFVIRVKQNSVVEIGENGQLPIGGLRKGLSRKKIVNHPINLWGLSLCVSIEKRKGAKEQMIVVSNFKFEDPLGMYRRRWEIETMFGCLKTRGFRMEDTHITDPDKIEKVVFVLAIAFCWAYRMGDIQDKIQAIQVKTHGRKARSLFREGLNLIRRAIFGRWVLKKFRRLLSCFSRLEPECYAL